MKKYAFLYCLFSILLITTACSFQAESNTTVEAAISKLTEDEFEIVGTHGLENS